VSAFSLIPFRATVSTVPRSPLSHGAATMRVIHVILLFLVLVALLALWWDLSALP
jgi:hypothetical protein